MCGIPQSSRTMVTFRASWAHRSVSRSEGRLPAQSALVARQKRAVRFIGTFTAEDCSPNCLPATHRLYPTNSKPTDYTDETDCGVCLCEICGICGSRVHGPVCPPSRNGKRHRRCPGGLASGV